VHESKDLCESYSLFAAGGMDMRRRFLIRQPVACLRCALFVIFVCWVLGCFLVRSNAFVELSLL
jgi:hypothetical protein